MKERSMKKSVLMIQAVLIGLLTTGICAQPRQIDIKPSANTVGRYEKVELTIKVDTEYDNPFDPDEVDLSVTLRGPDGEKTKLPAFYCQDYERQKLNKGRGRDNWYYPVGDGIWKARFAPPQTGTYQAAAVLKDRTGTIQSPSVRFDCTPSDNKGFLRTGTKDPRFMEFSDGSGFFSIGQNLAFIGEGQYVNLTKAEEIFAKLHANGANFLRIWTCCQDWAMAIEARKSAWSRSWQRNIPIVPIPGSENEPDSRKCVKIEGDDRASIEASPSHPVALRPGTRYALTGRFTAEGSAGLHVQLSTDQSEQIFDAPAQGKWKDFKHEFTAGANDFWLGRLALSLSGAGTVWLDKLSLKQIDGGPELLWEADVNRPARGVYNQLDCFMLDKVVEAAEQNGIYLMLCLITRDLYMKSLSDERSPEYQQAIADAQKFMRYAVARWGYSTNVAAWEYFNEIDPGLPTDRFYFEVGKYLENIDIYHHLRTTSTWHPSARDCRLDSLDIGQLHHYMRPETKEEFKDEVAVVLDKAKFLRTNAPNKPALIGEFGLADAKWGLSDYMKRDNEGVHFHRSLWASAFAGPSGTAMLWWWDQLDKQDAYGHYRPLSTFLADVSFVGLRMLEAAADNDKVRLSGYQGNNCAYIWLSSAEATWWNLLVERKQPKVIDGAKMEIKGLQTGNYNIEWWDTYEGKIVRQENASCSPGAPGLRAEIPPFGRDIACKIRLLRD